MTGTDHFKHTSDLPSLAFTHISFKIEGWWTKLRDAHVDAHSVTALGQLL